ncbi:MAG TPA: LysM peptidoglycan-binding domain-containing protein [Acidimicrobiia bacterium]|nr:LysM peptidoglycan-binding domain-containing protein [Acidimicrobiia bacterium]
MAAVLQLEPRFPAEQWLPADPGRSGVVRVPERRLRPIDSNRQPRPRPARRHTRAIYRRRRVLAALVGLGLVLTIARAGATLGGSSLAASERLPHVQLVVVEPGDSLWSIAQRVAPGRDVRPIVDAMARALGTTTVTAGQTIRVPAP